MHNLHKKKEIECKHLIDCLNATLYQEASISRSTTYLLSRFDELKHPYAVAITAYCLALCLPKGTDHSSTWEKLRGLATEGMSNKSKWCG